MRKTKISSVILAVLLLLTGCGNVNDNSSSDAENFNIVQQLETEHFSFFSKDEDMQCLKDLSNSLEDNYTRILNDLDTSLSKKVDIYIYTDLNTYHRAANISDTSTHVVGSALPGYNVIQMVNPSNAELLPYSDFMKIIVHEFAHTAIMSINTDVGTIPKWLNEGTASFEAKQDDGVEQLISKAKSSNNLPSFIDLETDSETFSKNGGYQFSYSIIDYIVKTYGYDKLIALIKSPRDFENILGVSKDDFHKQWIAQL
ncbi:MAG: peptidase MA family metallohydrolase [Bacillota bacterium]|nr:peptidase MA family metallohydrolase [Bacillota bacterium]